MVLARRLTVTRDKGEHMKTITVCCLAAAGTLALTACDAPTPSVRLDVSTDLAALRVAEAVSDRPASEAVKNLRERFRLGRTSDPGVGVFELEQPGAAPAVAFARHPRASGSSSTRSVFPPQLHRPLHGDLLQ